MRRLTEEAEFAKLADKSGFVTAAVAPYRMRNETKILTLCGFSHYYSHFYMLVFPTLALWIRDDLALPLGDTLELGFFMYLMFGMMALPLGMASDWWNSRGLLILFLLGTGVACIGCGLARTPGELKFALGTVGAFAAIYHPVGMGIISKCCANRGHALGWNGVYGNLGIALAPCLAAVLASTVGWRYSYFFFGAPCLIYGIWMLWIPIDETPVDRPQDRGTANNRSNLRFFCLMLGIMMLLGICYRGTNVMLPAYFEAKVAALTDALSRLPGADINTALAANILLTFTYLLASLGQLVGGRMADRMDLRAAYAIFHVITLPSMLMMSMLTDSLLVGMTGLYLFFALGMQPIENSLVARLTPAHLRGTSYGLKFIIVMGIGSISVKLVKYLLQHHSMESVFRMQAVIIVAVLCLIALFCGLTRGTPYRN